LTGLYPINPPYPKNANMKDRTIKEQQLLEALIARKEGKRVVRNGQIIVGNPYTGYMTQDGYKANCSELQEYLNTFYVLDKPNIILEGFEEEN
jgi:hypothetical protein